MQIVKVSDYVNLEIFCLNVIEIKIKAWEHFYNRMVTFRIFVLI